MLVRQVSASSPDASCDACLRDADNEGLVFVDRTSAFSWLHDLGHCFTPTNRAKAFSVEVAELLNEIRLLTREVLEAEVADPNQTERMAPRLPDVVKAKFHCQALLGKDFPGKHPTLAVYRVHEIGKQCRMTVT